MRRWRQRGSVLACVPVKFTGHTPAGVTGNQKRPPWSAGARLSGPAV